ncbi:MAG: hypothetical protein L6Q98_03980 [Anaerolineae bacterium]|nr:hypothetical protein [Anaerolineae bacterium]
MTAPRSFQATEFWRRRHQKLNIARGQFFPLTGAQFTERQQSDMRADQLAHLMTQLHANAADLTFFAFAHDDAQCRKAVIALDQCDDTRRGVFVFIQDDPIAPFIQHIETGQPNDFHLVGFAVLVARMGEPLRRCAVVGQDDQPLAVGVKPTDREEVFRHINQIVDGGTPIPLMRFARRQHVLGFVEGDEDLLAEIQLETRAIDGDDIDLRIGFVAQVGFLSVDENAPSFNQFFRRPARSRGVRLGEDLLQPYFHDLVCSILLFSWTIIQVSSFCLTG